MNKKLKDMAIKGGLVAAVIASSVIGCKDKKRRPLPVVPANQYSVNINGKDVGPNQVVLLRANAQGEVELDLTVFTAKKSNYGVDDPRLILSVGETYKETVTLPDIVQGEVVNIKGSATIPDTVPVGTYQLNAELHDAKGLVLKETYFIEAN